MLQEDAVDSLLKLTTDNYESEYNSTPYSQMRVAPGYVASLDSWDITPAPKIPIMDRMSAEPSNQQAISLRTHVPKPVIADRSRRPRQLVKSFEKIQQIKNSNQQQQQNKDISREKAEQDADMETTSELEKRMLPKVRFNKTKELKASDISTEREAKRANHDPNELSYMYGCGNFRSRANYSSKFTPAEQLHRQWLQRKKYNSQFSQKELPSSNFTKSRSPYTPETDMFKKVNSQPKVENRYSPSHTPRSRQQPARTGVVPLSNFTLSEVDNTTLKNVLLSRPNTTRNKNNNTAIQSLLRRALYESQQPQEESPVLSKQIIFASHSMLRNKRMRRQQEKQQQGKAQLNATKISFIS